jgi:glyoxylase I family protein
MSPVLSLHHVSILVADTGRALGFYRDILGLAVDESRPPMDFAGAWLQLGAQQIHLIERAAGRGAGVAPAGHGGRDRHFALRVRDLDSLAARLGAGGVELSWSRSGRRALFCRDPDGNAVELIEETG